MGLFDSLAGAFGIGSSKEKTTQSTSNWNPEQRKTAATFGEWVEPKIGQGSTGYSGARVAPISDAERSSIAWLNNYLNQETPQQYGWANRNLQDVMTGNYSKPVVDPTQAQKLYTWAQGQASGPLQQAQSGNIINDVATDALYQRIKDQILNRELPELQNTAANNANLRGMYFSGGHEKMQTDLMKNAQGQLLDTLANLKYSDEQARRDLEATREGRTYDTLANLLGTGMSQQYGDIQTQQGVDLQREQRAYDAIPLALDVGNAESNLALNKVAAGQAYGSLPRTLHQAELDARMEEFLRTLPENSPYLQLALQYLGQQGQQNFTGLTTGNDAGGTTILNKLMPFT